ncbi:MAG TPA: hypothetical protein VLM87_02155 [Rubrivivax sp.]|jgi:hypothetical protein|nr:hypothetical protein [Rubrivivax sp.]
MNTFVRQTCISMLAAGAMSAFAATDAGSGQVVEITASPAAVAAAQAVLSARESQTSYAMSTGRRMAVKSTGDALHVRYGRRMATTLRHDGQGHFVSADGKLALRFEPGDDGQAQHVRLTMPAAWL